MRVAYGPAVSSTPIGKRRAGRTDVCSQRAHVYFAIPRTLGGPDDYELANSKARRNIRLLGAEWVSAEATHDYAKYLASGRPAAQFPPERERWCDWYRLPLRGRTTNEITVLLREKGVKDGPYWGAGRVGESAGSGPELSPGKRSAPHREAVKATVRAGFVGGLLQELFGEQFSAELNGAPDADLSSWQHSQDDWEGLCQRAPGFRQAYGLIENRFSEAFAADDADGIALWGKRAAIIGRWIDEQLGKTYRPAYDKVSLKRNEALEPRPLDRFPARDTVGERGPVMWGDYSTHASAARIDADAAEFVAWQAFDACI